MDKSILQKHIKSFLKKIKDNPQKATVDRAERAKLVSIYQSWSSERILVMPEEDIYEYISSLWAMLIWGNKKYVIDKIIIENGIDKFRNQLNNLVWGKNSIEERWDNFRANIKHMGPAMISEILCKTHPDKYAIWNRRAFIAFRELGIHDLPTHDYQLTGKKYSQLCNLSKEISSELIKNGYDDNSLLSVDYFIWYELQSDVVLDKMHQPKEEVKVKITPKDSDFIHNEIRDKIYSIGKWLGFSTSTEVKIAEGSRVDTIWEASIGNMGRVIYVFEVQTSGSVDSLLINLLKALNNHAVQGIVAVSDKEQLQRIQKHAESVSQLKDKLKYWDYEEVLKVHDSLEFVYSSINNLKLVPQGF